MVRVHPTRRRVSVETGSVVKKVVRAMWHRQVSTVQREFVEKLLEHSVFSKHMAAVREINNMLTRAKSVRTSWADGGEKPMKVR